MTTTTMNARDAISARLATAYVTLNGKRYLLFQAKNFSAKFTKNKTVVPILGRTGEGNKANGWNGTFDLTIYQNTELFYNMMESYKNTGQDIYFDLLVTNYDPTSAAARKSVLYKGCNLNEGTLQSFDAAGECLEQEMSGTFEDYESPEKFTELKGM